MPFCSFSKDFTENAFTSVENQFITKYLPEADGDAVRVYLYGLYLCASARDFDAAGTAKLLRLSEEKLAEIYAFWEDCGLVQVLSRDPLFVEYLPVSAAVGKPKPIRPEKYEQFNRALFAILQRAEKFLKPYEQQRILEFLENNPMEQEAFLLVVEYCAKKDGKKLTLGHILNAAKGLVRNQKYTYEQVEAEYSDFNAYTEILANLFPKLGLYRKPREEDGAYVAKWLNAGIEAGAIYACADSMNRGSMPSLDELVCELLERGVKTKSEAQEYLKRRGELYAIVRTAAKYLNVKLEQPRFYIETYAAKWAERGYESESIAHIAALCQSLGYTFPEMDGLIDELYASGIVREESVEEYCVRRSGDLNVLRSVQKICGVVKKTQASLDMAAAWRSWGFSDEMILEAAKRSANAQSPLPYMNRLLSDWKQAGAFTPSEIPERESTPAVQKANAYRSEAAIAADERAERERFYSARRERAMRHAERARAIAERDETYRAAEAAIRSGEIEQAKAELYAPETLPALSARLEQARRERAEALARLRLNERDLEPQFLCEKCSDTGFLPDGRACDCYRK